MSAPPTLQPLTLTPWRSRWSQKARAVASSAFSVMTTDFGYHQAAEIVTAQGQLEIIEAGVFDSLYRRPDARGPEAVGDSSSESGAF